MFQGRIALPTGSPIEVVFVSAEVSQNKKNLVINVKYNDRPAVIAPCFKTTQNQEILLGQLLGQLEDYNEYNTVNAAIKGLNTNAGKSFKVKLSYVDKVEFGVGTIKEFHIDLDPAKF